MVHREHVKTAKDKAEGARAEMRVNNDVQPWWSPKLKPQVEFGLSASNKKVVGRWALNV